MTPEIHEPRETSAVPPQPTVKPPRPEPRWHPSHNHTGAFLNSETGEFSVEVPCPMCAAVAKVVVPQKWYFAWCAGQPIMNVLGQLAPVDRQRLVDGICERCWSHVFRDGEVGAQRLVAFLVTGIERRMRTI